MYGLPNPFGISTVWHQLQESEPLVMKMRNRTKPTESNSVRRTSNIGKRNGRKIVRFDLNALYRRASAGAASGFLN